MDDAPPTLDDLRRHRDAALAALGEVAQRLNAAEYEASALQETCGRLTAERDAAQAELAQLRARYQAEPGTAAVLAEAIDRRGSR